MSNSAIEGNLMRLATLLALMPLVAAAWSCGKSKAVIQGLGDVATGNEGAGGEGPDGQKGKRKSSARPGAKATDKGLSTGSGADGSDPNAPSTPGMVGALPTPNAANGSGGGNGDGGSLQREGTVACLPTHAIGAQGTPISLVCTPSANLLALSGVTYSYEPEPAQASGVCPVFPATASLASATHGAPGSCSFRVRACHEGVCTAPSPVYVLSNFDVSLSFASVSLTSTDAADGATQCLLAGAGTSSLNGVDGVSWSAETSDIALATPAANALGVSFGFSPVGQSGGTVNLTWRVQGSPSGRSGGGVNVSSTRSAALTLSNDLNAGAGTLAARTATRSPANTHGPGRILQSTDCVGCRQLDGAVTQIVASDRTACSLTAASASASPVVRCWGENVYGQVGVGTQVDVATPTVVNVGTDPAVFLTASSTLPTTCAVLASGQAKCWGANHYGQLSGNASPSAQTSPVSLPLPTGYPLAQIAIGEDFLCGRFQQGGVSCWGRRHGDSAHANKNLGDGLTGARMTAAGAGTVPVWVGGLEGTSDATSAIDIAAGSRHGCAITADKKLRCWGSGTYGRNFLATCTAPNSCTEGNAATATLSPVVTEEVAQLAAGDDVMCVLVASGADARRVKCVGRGDLGKNGHVSGESDAYPAVVRTGAATPLEQVVALSYGEEHGCAIVANGSVWCWGKNTSGQLGNDASAYAPSNYALPVDASRLGGASVKALAVAAGDDFTCALTSLGVVRCWGDNARGQLGLTSPLTTWTPGLVPGSASAGVTHVAVTQKSTCYVDAGAVKCVSSEAPLLGNGGLTPNGSAAFVDVSGLSGVTALTAGENFHCALYGSPGQVKCWGYNGNFGGREGRLGYGHVLQTAPGGGSENSVYCGTASDPKRDATSGDDLSYCAFSYLLDQEKSTPETVRESFVLVDGNPNVGARPVLTHVAKISSGMTHSCLLRDADGAGAGTTLEARCFGYNANGRLGDNSTIHRGVPTPVSGLASGMVDIAAGDEFSCALKDDGTVWCWGRNQYGQLGVDVATTQSLVPVQTLAPAAPYASWKARRVFAGGDHACAIYTDSLGTPTQEGLFCWGRNHRGQMGRLITGPTGAEGETWRAAEAYFPQPRISDRWELASAPLDGSLVDANGVFDAGALADVSLGLETTCVKVDEGAIDSLHCFGRRDGGRIGNGQSTGSSDTPVRTIASGVLAVAMKDTHGCAVVQAATPEVHCWGARSDLQQGTRGIGTDFETRTAAMTPLATFLQRCLTFAASLLP